MDFSNWWYSSGATGAGGGGDQGENIGDSLRFRGAQFLQRTGVDTTTGSLSGTFSVWYKRGYPEDNNIRTIFNSPRDSDAQLNPSRNSRDFRTPSNGNATPANCGQLRDPSAWYHIVNNYDRATNLSNLWINGRFAGSVDILNDSGADILRRGDQFIGCAGTVQFFQGYLAEFHALEGTVLRPESFGRENAEGVWVPREPVRADGETALTSDDYGRNGWYLDFADGDDLGRDRAPVGDDGHTQRNDFTPNGFDTQRQPVTTYRIESPKDFGSALNVTENVGTIPVNAPNLPTGSTGLFTLAQPVRSVTIRNQNNGTQCTVEVSDTGEADSWTTIIDNGTWNGQTGQEITHTADFRFVRIGFAGGGYTWSTISEPDGPSPDFDLMTDSPTQNFATLNSLQVFRDTATTGTNFSQANLRESQQTAATSTIGMPVDSGVYYWEATWDNTNNSTDYMGMALQPLGPGAPQNGFTGWTWVNTNTITWLQEGTIGDQFNVPARPVTFGWQYDSDAHTLTVFQNGTQINQFTGCAEETWYALGMGLGATAGQKTFNFGQLPFLDRPAALDDDTELQTENLPTPTILNGRDHFRAITSTSAGTGYWLGAGIALDAEFDPDDEEENEVEWGQPTGTLEGKFVIDFGQEVTNAQVFVSAQILNVVHTTSRDGTTWAANANITFDTPSTTVNGTYRYIAISNGGGTWVPSRLQGGGEPILTQAQEAFDQGLWWIKDRDNDTNHQLVDSVRGQVDGDWQAIWSNSNRNQQDYAAPTGNSVAWCWSAPDAWASTDDDVTAGTIASNGRRNVAAGFSIVSYTGAGAPDTTNNGTVAHGLSQTPEFVIYSNFSEDIVDIPVYHSGLTAGNNLFLNGNNSQSNTAKFPNPPDENLLRIGSINDINGSGDNFIAYCWHSVPGYSAFGTYNGNSSANGPLIVTGFRPAFIMYKCLSHTSLWYIQDSTRSLINPQEAMLWPNLSSPEPVPNNSGNFVDFLSNGFKIRNGDGDQNTIGRTFVWAAWAENPFGGENIAPANAR